MASQVPSVLLPLNGQYCTPEDFVRRIEAAIEAANYYGTRAVARPAGKTIQKQLKNLMADYFKDVDD